ncbi:hypothetical protein C8J57DRAFT_1282110 [Mycena rebaudengoi]|nr:hypothetical protein C8J57DRAFT_1282110 [Mycena rebaudengoi]
MSYYNALISLLALSTFGVGLVAAVPYSEHIDIQVAYANSDAAPAGTSSQLGDILKKKGDPSDCSGYCNDHETCDRDLCKCYGKFNFCYN